MVTAAGLALAATILGCVFFCQCFKSLGFIGFQVGLLLFFNCHGWLNPPWLNSCWCLLLWLAKAQVAQVALELGIPTWKLQPPWAVAEKYGPLGTTWTEVGSAYPCTLWLLPADHGGGWLLPTFGFSRGAADFHLKCEFLG